MDPSLSLFETRGDALRVRLRTAQTDPHSNLVPCIILGREQAVSIQTPRGVIKGRALYVGANFDHIVDFHGGMAEVIYLEGSAEPNSLRESCGVRVLSVAGARRLERDVDNWSPDCAAAILETFDVPKRQKDSAIASITDLIATDPMARISESQASALCQLERTTMLRRFKAQTGMTFRAYKSWVALKYATGLVIAGEQIGCAGLDSGFADAAHFSRQFKSVFGLSPTHARACIV